MSHEPSNVSERSRQSPLRRRIDVGAQTERAELTEPAEPIPANSAVLSSELSLESQADSFGIPFWGNPQNHDVSRDFVERISVGFARQHAILAFHTDDVEDDTLYVAIGSMESWSKLDVVGRILKRPVRPVFAPEERILTAINAAYQQQQGQAASAVQVLDENELAADLADLVTPEDLLDGAGKPPVIRLVNSILFEAVRARASDVHVQPQENKLIVRQRIDGVLFDTIEVPASHQEEVISRLKILGKMNIAEKRLPQDGRATVQFGDRLVDLRIASLPTSFGERVVVRFLDKNSRLYSLDELGMGHESLSQLRSLIRRDHGMLLATGPTGSGKSTSLYAALQEIDSTDLNVLTLEDPIEYQLDGISQTQVNNKKGLTFAQGLRHVLRQDPDIIMVGEIRDHETAVMAIQSALTGHLVFSTLHTNDAASAIARLVDLGIEPYLVASSVIAVVAQRLVRQICPQCKREVANPEVRLRELGIPESQVQGRSLYEGAGCDDCRQTGYSGRVGIFEVLVVSDPIRDLIQTRTIAQQIRSLAVQGGTTLLREDGIRKAFEGITTVEEVLRVTACD